MKDTVTITQHGDPEPVTADATALSRALIELRNAWRDDNAVFSVRVMKAVGAAIAETEVVFDFEDTAEGVPS